ncbi:MAG: hypothetical protein AB7O97_15660 [Planctomycetota bacterium]
MSTAWNDASNWSAGVPSVLTDAIVAPAANQPDTTGAPSAACRNLTVQAGASLSAPVGFPLSIQGSIACAGSVVGELRLTGSGAIATSGTGLLENVRVVAGPYTVDAQLATLDQQPGSAAITIQSCRASVAATFRGAGLLGGPGSLLESQGSVTVQATAPVTAPPSLIRLGAIWTSDASWQPASGAVWFVGSGAAIANVAPGTVWSGLEIENVFGLTHNGDLRVAGALRMRNDLRVNGAVVDLTQPAGITIGSELRGNSVTQLRIRNGVTSAGIIDLPNAVADVDGNVTFFVTGLLSVGAGVHRFSNSVGIAGGFAAPASATLEFDGSGTITIAPFNVLPAVRITGSSYTILDATVGGDLTHAVGAGDLNVFRCAVNGNCALSGNSVRDFTGGLLDVAGNVVWQTVAVVNTPPSVVFCAGSWTANASFQPTSGLVVFDGVGPKSVTMPAFAWNSLRIAPTAQVATPLAVRTSGTLDVQGGLQSGGGDIECFGPMLVSGSVTAPNCLRVRAHAGLVVGGSVQAPQAFLDVDGDTDVDGAVTLGNGNHVLTGSLLVAGSLAMPAGQIAVFDGGGVVDVVPTSPIPNVRFAGGDYQVDALTVGQDLVQISGVLAVRSCEVQRDATMQGTGLVDVATGLLDVGRDVRIQLSAPTTQPPATIRCGGNWLSDASFAPASGLVEFDGVGAQTVTMPAIPWFDLRVAASASVALPQDVLVQGGLDVLGQLSAVGTGVQVSGPLTIGSAGLLTAAGATTVALGASATVSGGLQIGAAVATVQGDLHVAAGGVLAAGAGPHQLSSGLDVDGTLVLPPGSAFHFVGTGTIDVQPSIQLPQVTFTNGPYVVTRLVVAGQITQTGGRLQVRSLTGLGNAVFQGLSVDNVGPGVLDVRGNIDFATSNVVVSPPALIRCGANWSSNPQFLPTSGEMEMNGLGPQVLSSPQLRLVSLIVDAGSQVTFGSADVILEQDLLVRGAVTAPSSLLEVRGNLDIGPVGSLAVDSGSVVAVSKSLTNAGAIAPGIGGAGAVRMVGDGAVSGAGLFTGIDIDTVGLVAVQGGVLVASLNLLSGTLSLVAGANLHVQGDLLAATGALRGAAGSVLDVDGDVFLDAVTADPIGVPDLRCGGDYTAGATFAPTNGTVFFDGTGDLKSLTGALSFAQVEVAAGVRSVATDIDATAAAVRVLAPAQLDLGGRALGVAAATIDVQGTLSIGAGGALTLGAAAVMTVPAGGLLRMVGTFDAPATIDGPPGGGYAVLVDGAIEAMNFAFANMGPAGVRIRAAATIAASPRDLRAGTFRDGDPTPGSCLLHLDRAVATQVRYARFEAGAATFNVRSTGAGVVAFVNESGAFAGPTFEDDGGGVIDWLPPERTALVGFSARPAIHRAELAFATDAEVDVARFEVQRATSPGGPWVEIANSPLVPLGSPSTGGAYQATDFNTVDTTRYTYRLQEVLLHGEPRQLGSDFARPWPQQVGNTWFVGTNGGYPDIAAAVAAAGPGGQIVVQAGTYPAFTITKAVRIMPDGSGPVRIDTSLGKLVVRDIPASEFDLALYDLEIGTPTSPFGMEVLNCDNVIVLDGLQVRAALGVTGLLVDDSDRVAIQTCDFAGDPGLRFANGAGSYLSRGAIDELELTGGSIVQQCDVTPGATNVGIGSSLVPVAGGMPDVRFPTAWTGEKPVPFTITTDPSSFYGLLYSLRRDYLDLTVVFPIDMVLLIDHSQAVVLSTGFVPTGSIEVPMVAPGLAQLWGLHLPLQLFELKSTGSGRMSNSRDVVLLP